jgi:hypothetical protein
VSTLGSCCSAPRRVQFDDVQLFTPEQASPHGYIEPRSFCPGAVARHVVFSCSIEASPDTVAALFLVEESRRELLWTSGLERHQRAVGFGPADSRSRFMSTAALDPNVDVDELVDGFCVTLELQIAPGRLARASLSGTSGPRDWEDFFASVPDDETGAQRAQHIVAVFLDRESLALYTDPKSPEKWAPCSAVTVTRTHDLQ